MIRFSPIEEQQAALQFAVPEKSMLALRITLKSKFAAPAVIQPKLHDWINDKGEIIQATCNILPLYIFLPPSTTVTLTITINIPPELKEHDVIRSTLQFSSFKHCDLGIQVVIDNSGGEGKQFHEHALELSIPHTTDINNLAEKNDLFNAEAVQKTIAGLSGLEMIPAKWLVAELLFALCEKGMQEASRPENAKTIKALQRTKFFKNGVLVVSGAQLTHWVMMNMSISAGMQAAAGQETAGMLQQWKNILLSLSASDIEMPGPSNVLQSFFENNNYETIAEKMGMDPDKWFLYLVLGLMSISPGMHSILQQISNAAPGINPVAKKKKSTVKKVIHEKGSLQQ